MESVFNQIESKSQNRITYNANRKRLPIESLSGQNSNLNRNRDCDLPTKNTHTHSRTFKHIQSDTLVSCIVK